MLGRTLLIVNADDFGQSPEVNLGVMEAHDHGILTSGSLMVRWPAAGPAAEWARAREHFSLGLHLDCGEWIREEGEWKPLYEVVSTDDEAELQAEIGSQLEAFRRITGGDPTHLDSHQHFHMSEPARSIAMEFARQLGIPLRGCSPHVRYCGDFYGQDDEGEPFPQGISLQAMLRLLSGLPPGITELACHPGLGNSPPGPYREERNRELLVLCDARVRVALRRLGIELVSFQEVSD